MSTNFLVDLLELKLVMNKSYEQNYFVDQLILIMIQYLIL